MGERTGWRRWPWLLLAAFLLVVWALLLFQSDWKVTDRLLGSATRNLSLAAAVASDHGMASAELPAQRAHAVAEAAAERTDGPLWWLLGRTSLGPNLLVAQQLVVVADAASSAVLEPSCARVQALATARADLEALDSEVPRSVATARQDMLDLAEILHEAAQSEAGCPGEG